jgi:hypothetical protein
MTLWHVSEDGSIPRFEPRADPTHDSPEALAALRCARVFAYRLPPETFEPYGRAAGYFVSREAVEPVEVVELDDLIGRHAEAGIELRIVPELRPLWERVIASTLEFSGIRLRNLKSRT